MTDPTPQAITRGGALIRLIASGAVVFMLIGVPVSVVWYAWPVLFGVTSYSQGVRWMVLGTFLIGLFASSQALLDLWRER